MGQSKRQGKGKPGSGTDTVTDATHPSPSPGHRAGELTAAFLPSIFHRPRAGLGAAGLRATRAAADERASGRASAAASLLRAPGRPAAAARTRPERWSPRRPGTRAGPQQRQGGGGGGDAGRRGGVLQPSAACCFVSFRNTFPSLRKVSGAFAGVSSPGAPREARRARGPSHLGPSASARARAPASPRGRRAYCGELRGQSLQSVVWEGPIPRR